jgi:tetratricopeptide (TPR) repeat protein
MQLFTEIGDKRYVARQLINLGIIRERKAEYDAARELLDQALRLSRELGEKIGTTESLALLGTVARKQGDYVAARKLIAESLAKYRELGDREGIASCFDEFAGCASAEGQLERTALFLGIADGLREAVSSHVPPAYQTDRERDITLVRSALGKEVFLAEWGKGRTMNLEEAIGYVIDAFRRNIKDSEDE